MARLTQSGNSLRGMKGLPPFQMPSDNRKGLVSVIYQTPSDNRKRALSFKKIDVGTARELLNSIL